MNAGWIKLHRQLLENPRFKDPDWVAVWTYLLLTATHAHREALFDGKRVELKPGQLITGRFVIAKSTGVHASKVYRILETLKTDHQIEQQAGAKSSMITVLNWSLYQNIEQQSEQQPSSNRAASEQQPNTLQEGEEGKEALPPSPEESDVSAFGFSNSIPTHYCQFYFRERTKKRSWWTKRSELIDWQMDLIDWWAEDRNAYNAKQHRAHPEFQKRGSHPQATNQRPDRNVGTANEGLAEQYRLAPKPTAFTLKTQFDAIEAEMKAIKERGTPSGGGGWTAANVEDRDRWAELSAKKKEVRLKMQELTPTA